MRRCEHYREWRGSQNIIDSIRNAEIEENRLMDIPSCTKRPGYSGYPSTKGSYDGNHNATPGPSRPKLTIPVRTHINFRIRQAVSILPSLIAPQGHHKGVITIRIILVTQTLKVHLIKPTYQVVLSTVILNLILWIQRVMIKALELYITVAQMMNTDRTQAISVITKVIQITLPTTDPARINIRAMIIDHRGDN